MITRIKKLLKNNKKSSFFVVHSGHRFPTKNDMFNLKKRSGNRFQKLEYYFRKYKLKKICAE